MQLRFPFFALFLLAASTGQAQTFTANPNATIPDNNTVVAFNINVTGLPAAINTSFGLQTVCLNMTHTYCSDMEVSLKAPDGTTVVLFSGVGGGADDFLNTCLEGTGTPIASGNAPFTGTWQAMSVMGDVNNGQNPNGTWQLLCRDMAAVDIGYLTMWSLTFSNNPAQPFTVTSSNLPIVFLTTQGSPIVNDPKVPVWMQIIDNGPGVRNYTNQTNFAYEGMIMAELQGFTGPLYPRKNYDFETVDALGEELDTTILGLPTEHDWIFKAEYLDRTLMKNRLTYEMANRMGVYAPRTRPCEVFLDGSYMGYYTLTEKPKRDANRVDIAKLLTTDTAGANLTGGYIIEMNINGDPGDWNSLYLPANWATSGQQVQFKFVYPRRDSMVQVQKDYIHAYTDSFEIALNGPNFTDPNIGYRKYVDISTFIDFMIVNEFSVNYDSYGRSTFLYKEKITDGGKLKCGPPWDYDRAYDYTNFNNYMGWVWLNTHPYWPFPNWWTRWWSETAYRQQAACRWLSLRQDVLSDDSMMVFIDSLHSVTSEAAGRNFTVWNTLGGWTYDQHVDSLKAFVLRRLDWIDQEFAVENVSLPSFYLPTDSVFCAGSVYDASFNGSSYSYNWQPGPDSSVIVFTVPGNYTLVVTGAHGCYAHQDMDVSISTPDAGFTAVQGAGNGMTWTFTPNDLTASSYNWNFGDGGTSTQMSPVYTYAASGNYTVTLNLADAAGCIDQDQQVLNWSVGTASAQSTEWTVFPVPFTNELSIRYEGNAGASVQISLMNEWGQMVQQHSLAAGSHEFTLSTGGLPAGLYLLSLEGTEGKQVMRVVKMD